MDLVIWKLIGQEFLSHSIGQQIFAAHNVQRVALWQPVMSRRCSVKYIYFNNLASSLLLDCWVHLEHRLCARGRNGSCRLTNLLSPVESAELAAVQATTSKKNGWLPLLTVLFLVSYGLMTMLIVEQGLTIESQRALIRDLFHDSTELSAVKMKSQRNAVHPTPSAHPSTQDPSTQAPAKQDPSTQAGSQHRSQVDRQKSFQMPSRPAADITERRRALISI